MIALNNDIDMIDLANDDSRYLVQFEYQKAINNVRLSSVHYYRGSEIIDVISGHIIVDDLYDDYHPVVDLSRLSDREVVGKFRRYAACDRFGALIGSEDYYINIAQHRTKRHDKIILRRWSSTEVCTIYSAYDIVSYYNNMTNRYSQPGIVNAPRALSVVAIVAQLYQLYVDNAIDQRFNAMYRHFVDVVAKHAIKTNDSGFTELLKFYPSAYAAIVNKYRELADIVDPYQ